MADAAVAIARPALLSIRTLIAGASALALAVAVGYWAFFARGWEDTDDAFVEGHLVLVSPRVAGQVLEVAVEENQHVREGQLLVRLDAADQAARVARARADLDAARNRTEEARASADAAAAQSVAARVELGRVERELARVQGLHDKNIVSPQTLDAAGAARDAAAAQLHALEQREQAARAVLGNDAPIRQAEAALHEAELVLEHLEIRAAFAGTVGRKSVEAGANVAPGQPLLALTSDERKWVIANFKETQIGAMRPGAPAEIRVDAYPGVVWRGHVESIAPATGAKYALIPPDNASGSFTKVTQRVPVRIAFDDVARGDAPDVAAGAGAHNPPLPAGLSVDVSVSVR